MIYLQANEWLLAMTKALRDYENRFFMQSGQYRDLGIDKYFEFHCKVYYPSMRSDLDNSLKILLDCLQKCKAIKNDNLCVKVVAEKFIDKANPRVEFKIMTIE
jgi:Holliday junction resolvase RusA-like endonuclease